MMISITSPSPVLRFYENHQIVEDVEVMLLDGAYELPAVQHPQYDPIVSLYAVVIKLHQRVEELERAMENEDEIRSDD